MIPVALRAMLVLGVCSLLAACGSTPPVRYYLLSADAAPASAAGGPSLGIAELKVAEYLQRPQLVTLESANRLQVREFERWAEPLADGVQRTLALNLAALLATDSVRVRPWPREWSPDWELRLSVARLDVRADAVELVASWSLAHEGRIEERSSRLARPRSDATVDAVAADTSALLLELSREIAAAVLAARGADAD